MAASQSLTLITASDCHLCERARKVLRSVSEETRLVVREIAWEGEEASSLVRRDGVPFPPAVYVNGSLAGYGRLSERALRRRLAEVPD
ncbi:MAG TPA: thioredoxin family protein [Candidatus Dormibacteraeota bacterium]